MGRRLTILGVVATVLIPALETQAAPFVEVTYDLGDSSAISIIPVINSTAQVPSEQISGQQTIRYTSDSAGNLAVGPAELVSFNLFIYSATAGYSIYTTGGGKTFKTVATSDLHFEFLGLTGGAGTGQRLAGGTVTAGGASGIFRMTGVMHCFDPPNCQIQRVYPSSEVALKPDTFTAPLPSLTGAIGQPHTVRGTATGIGFVVDAESVGIGPGIGIPVFGTTFIVGREVFRRSVPEPGTLPLATFGLCAVVLAGAAARRRVRSAARRA